MKTISIFLMMAVLTPRVLYAESTEPSSELGTMPHPQNQAHVAPVAIPSDQVRLQKATQLNQQGLALLSEGKYNDALTQFLESLAIREQLLDKWHLDTAISYSNIGVAYDAMGDYPKVLEFYNKALVILEKVLGKAHPDTASSYHNIGSVYNDMGDYPKALEFYNKALVIDEKVLGKAHPDTAISYNNIGVVYDAMGDYPKALEFYNKALVIEEKVRGKAHPSTAISYNNIGSVYKAMGDSPKALEFYNKALVIEEKVRGKAHPSTAISYNNIGSVYKAMGDSPKALEFYNKALVIEEKVRGKAHPSTAISYNNIGSVYKAMGDYPKALEFYNKALVIWEKVRGKVHPSTAATYNNIGEVYRAMGDYPKALEFYNKALVIQEKVLGKAHPDTATTYNNIGEAYRAMGDYPKALELLNKALVIREKVLGKEHPDTAQSYNNIGLVYNSMGDYPKALEFYNKALVILEKVLGKAHPNTAATYNNIGGVYKAMGDYPKALEFYHKALVIQDKVLGKTHPSTAISYNNIGSVYHDMGDFPKTLEFYNKALVTQENVLGKAHPDTAQSYHNIGVVYNDMGDYPKALEFHNKALVIREKVLGKAHPGTAQGYNNIGRVYKAMGNYPKELEFYSKALVIQEKVLGKAHPDTAASYNNIGAVYYSTGDYPKALEFLNKALVIEEKVLGQAHPSTATSYHNIGAVYADMGNYPRAYQFAKQAFTTFLSNRQNNFSALDNPQKKQFLKANERYIDFLLKHASHYLNDLRKANKTEAANTLIQTTLNDWLAYKGSILDNENRLLALAQNSTDPNVKEKYTALVAAKRAYSQLNKQVPDTEKKRTQWQARLKAQEATISQLERAIAQLDTRFKKEQDLQAISSQDIANSLDSNTLYTDFAKTNDGYYLFTIDPQNTLSFSAYSEENSRAIDKAVTTFQASMSAIAKDRQQIGTVNDNTKPALDQLYQTLFTQPLLTRMADKDSLIISPDGALRLLPFEALWDKTANEYLIESKNIRYIASGKEWIRLIRQNKAKKSTQNGAFILYDPDFGGQPSQTSANNRSGRVGYTDHTDERRTLTLLEYFSDSLFDALPGTKTEADAISALLPNATVKRGLDANEAYLLSLQYPRIVHIATHGFFLKDILNPMLKSGLILAGAQQSLKANTGDGIVTALDLSGLQLQGTDLVVLSACETGTVDPNNTDGISGLTKAFIQAGAKNVVMSLWSVADDETAALMTAFYTAGQQDESYAQALKTSKLALLEQGLHPYYWSAFVLSGL